MKAIEEFTAYGHVSIVAMHRTTFEITKGVHLTRRGDCVVAVASEKGVRDLSDEMKTVLRKAGSKLTMILQAGEEREVVEASGSSELTLGHSEDMVIRKSNFVCDRTLAVKANKTAVDFSRTFVKKLKNPQQKIDVTLIVEEAT